MVTVTLLMVELSRARYLMPSGTSSLSIDSFSRLPSYSSSHFASLPSSGLSIGSVSNTHQFPTRHPKRYHHHHLGPSSNTKHYFKASNSILGSSGSTGHILHSPSYSFPKDFKIGSLTTSISNPSFNSLNGLSSSQSGISSIGGLENYPFSSSPSSSPFSSTSGGSSFESSLSLDNPFDFDSSSSFSTGSPFGISSSSSIFDKMPQMSSSSSSSNNLMTSTMPQQNLMMSSGMGTIGGSSMTRPTQKSMGSINSLSSSGATSTSLQQQVPSSIHHTSTSISSNSPIASTTGTTSSSTIPHMTINFNLPAFTNVEKPSNNNGPMNTHQMIASNSNSAPATTTNNLRVAEKQNSPAPPALMSVLQSSNANVSEELNQQSVAPSTTMSISFSIPQFPNSVNSNASSFSIPNSVNEPMIMNNQMQPNTVTTTNSNEISMNNPQMMMNSAVQQQQQQQQMMMSAAASETHPSFAADLSFSQADLMGSTSPFDSDNYLSEYTQSSPPSSLSSASLGLPISSLFSAGGYPGRSILPSSSGLLGLSFTSPQKGYPTSHTSFASPYGIF
ncbi:hypothetical protein QAD02_000579 [Eretmocerus hayati]|uniref:Uncharacterized protein n=1 Tax=Eretmocerus hayati TaxID=131215 RepID=A0ACC2NDV1_9HYME|nr:hypothetical protein QAD02_000579 [Eretmocerus hayati]